MKHLAALMLALAVTAMPAVAQISAETQARIDRVKAERDAKMMNRYQEEIKAAKGNANAINAAQRKYAPMFESKVIGTDPALSPEQRVKLRAQNLRGNAERVSETEAAISASTVVDWREDVAREHAVDSFRNNDPKTMKMMFDARRKELEEAPRR